MARVFLIEDSEEGQLTVRRALASPDIRIVCAQTVSESKKILQEERGVFDLVILDLGLPDGDGFALLDDLQAHDALQSTPIFLLTQRDDLTSKIMAFGLGVEDYIVKPVNPIELRARVEMRLKKSQLKQNNLETLKKGDLVLHTALMKVSFMAEDKEEDLDLTSKEFRILFFLAKNEGKVFTRPQLVKKVWGDGIHVLDRTVDSHICGLRRKLGKRAHYIESIPGAGYRFLTDRDELEQLL